VRASKTISFAINCPHCGHNTPQTVAWLAVHNQMPCGACGLSINLESGQNAAVIERLAQECLRLDAIAAKRK